MEKNDMAVGYGLQWCILGGHEVAVSQLQRRPAPPFIMTLLYFNLHALNLGINLSNANSRKKKNLKWGLYAFELFFLSGTYAHNYADCNTFMLVCLHAITHVSSCLNSELLLWTSVCIQLTSCYYQPENCLSQSDTLIIHTNANEKSFFCWNSWELSGSFKHLTIRTSDY